MTTDSVTAPFGSITLDPAGLLALTDAAGKVLSRANLSLTTASGQGGTAISATVGASASAKFYGSGAGHRSGFQLAKLSSQPKVENTELEVSRFWSTDGFSALGVSPLPNNAGPGQAGNGYGASWDATPDVYLILGLGLLSTTLSTHRECLSANGVCAFPPTCCRLMLAI